MGLGISARPLRRVSLLGACFSPGAFALAARRAVPATGVYALCRAFGYDYGLLPAVNSTQHKTCKRTRQHSEQEQHDLGQRLRPLLLIPLELPSAVLQKLGPPLQVVSAHDSWNNCLLEPQ